MRVSLQTRVAFFVSVTVVLVIAVSTLLFIRAHVQSERHGLIVRGAALSYALAKAAEEGIVKEDLSLIRKSSTVIRAPDVTRAQVYSDLWDVLDAYPVTALHDPPDPAAIAHFKHAVTPFSRADARAYDFYYPVFFRVTDTAHPIVIGYVRLTLSSDEIQHSMHRIVVTNISTAAVITIIAVVILNLLLRRFVVQPIVALHASVARFKGGDRAGGLSAPRGAANEIRELSEEFIRMAVTVGEKEHQLIESERRIRDLFERVEHAVFRIDDRGVITEANGRFRELFGDVGGLCDILVSDISAGECLSKAAETTSLHLDAKAVNWEGNELAIQLSLYPERDAAGKAVGFDGYILDVTERKRLEERLMRSQKLEAVGTLAAGLAHDFNNLMTAILGYSGILLKAVHEGDPFYKPVTVIHDAAKRGAELGKKILTATRKEKMHAQPVDLNELVSHTVDLLRGSLPPDIELATTLHVGLQRTQADPSQLQQVLINLAMNARDAMPEGGRLIVETGTAERGFVRLSVADTGTGIDAAAQEKIFDPFYTTKDAGKGTGLGLYMVHSIVSNHGGYLNVYSEPGKGTRFHIYLPVAKGDLSGTAEPTEPLGGTETLLIIDDEAAVRNLGRDLLEPLGYRVLTAAGGSEGVELYRERQQEIALVILDMVMPRMGGNETFAALRAVNRNVRVLLYSGYSDGNFAGIKQLLEQGAAGFVQKPFSARELGQAVRKALAA